MTTHTLKCWPEPFTAILEGRKTHEVRRKKERPILFSGAMVRALLAGTKTQTRRIVKPQPAALCRYEMNGAGTHALHLGPPMAPGQTMSFVPPTPKSKDHRLACPYGAPGERLWVRETWQAIRVDHDGSVDAAPEIPKKRGSWSRVYAATDKQADYHRDDRGFGWRPGIHMPRWASRITLEIESVRVQRLHDISEADAWAEGIESIDGLLDDAAICAAAKLAGCGFEDARATFAALWCEINGADSWKANPWVWCVSWPSYSRAGNCSQRREG